MAACRACAPVAKYDTSLMGSGDNQVRQAEKLTDAISAYLYSDKPGSESTDRGLKRIVRGLQHRLPCGKAALRRAAR